MRSSKRRWDQGTEGNQGNEGANQKGNHEVLHFFCQSQHPNESPLSNQKCRNQELKIPCITLQYLLEPTLGESVAVRER